MDKDIKARLKSVLESMEQLKEHELLGMYHGEMEHMLAQREMELRNAVIDECIDTLKNEFKSELDGGKECMENNMLYMVVICKDELEPGEWGVAESHYLLGMYDSEEKAEKAKQDYMSTNDKSAWEHGGDYLGIAIHPVELNKTYSEDEMPHIAETVYIE